MEDFGNELFNAKEAAKRLGISTRKLWELKSVGEIKHCCIGNRVLYSALWLKEFVEARTSGGVK